jgi:chromosome segregation ATPase
MEFEQLINRLDWLDEEHRKDKQAMAALEERISGIEGDLKSINKKLKQLGAESTRLSTAAARIEQVDSSLSQQRTEMKKYVDSIDKKQGEKQKEFEKRLDLKIGGVNKSIDDLQIVRESLSEMQREAKARNEEETRRHKLLSDWETRMEGMVQVVEKVGHAQHLAEEGHRQDLKRLAELQGETSSARKRLDEVREKNDLLTDGVRRIETRLNEVLAGENERRLSQTTFIENQARLQVERDRIWKEWEQRFESLRKQTENMDSQLAQWDAAQRAVKRAQEAYEEIVQKFDRRINEITEMQRLAEDRFRQEWVSFKSDDQKRWTSYTLSQDELHKDAQNNLDKIQERVTSLEDLAQTQQDVLQQTKEANEQLFQGMLAQIHELLTAYERIMGTK